MDRKHERPSFEATFPIYFTASLARAGFDDAQIKTILQLRREAMLDAGMNFLQEEAKLRNAQTVETGDPAPRVRPGLRSRGRALTAGR